MRCYDNTLNRARITRPKAIALAAILFQKAGTAVVGIACIVGLFHVTFQAEALSPEDPPGSGIIVREITQIRRLSEAADYLDELQTVMATVAGRPPRYEGRDYSHARVEFIPASLQAVDPREAITRLMAEPFVGDESSPTGGLDSARKTDSL